MRVIRVKFAENKYQKKTIESCPGSVSTHISIPLCWYSKNGSSNSIADVAYGDKAS